MNTKGIILAGGHGSRLWPMTKLVSKQMLNVYDKPMIYYPLCSLMLAGIKDICIISQEKNIKIYQDFLGSGNQFGINISYESQNIPRGLPDALNVTKEFIKDSDIVLALGDNIFYGHDFEEKLKEGINNLKDNEASILVHKVRNPSEFGVVKKVNGKILQLIEKPKEFVSNLAVTGFYFLPNDAVNFTKSLKPSDRDELEITDLLNEYLLLNRLKDINTGRGTFWTDSGTVSSLNDASNFVKAIQDSQGLVICAPEEIAFHKGFITKDDYISSIEDKSSEYAVTLLNSLELDNESNAHN